ncbi:MAG: hypothetical protein ABEJ82_06655 [Haloplanus sp.]
MTRSDTDTDLNCKAFHRSDGRYEIRETDNDDGWIRTDDPVPVER